MVMQRLLVLSFVLGPAWLFVLAGRLYQGGGLDSELRGRNFNDRPPRNNVLYPSLECRCDQTITDFHGNPQSHGFPRGRCSEEPGWVANTRWVRRTDVSGGSLAYLPAYLLAC